MEIKKDLEIINYIIVDSIDNIKKYELETWFKNTINTSNGIWIGNGINDQFTLKVNQRIEEMREDVPKNFCFVIVHGKPKFVKYVSELKLK